MIALSLIGSTQFLMILKRRFIREICSGETETKRCRLSHIVIACFEKLKQMDFLKDSRFNGDLLPNEKRLLALIACLEVLRWMNFPKVTDETYSKVGIE